MKNNKHKAKLFVIDDDLASRLLITEFLEGADVTIIECGRGNEAIPLFREIHNETVLVLLDILLPGCNGWDLLKQLRNINSAVPVIAISAISLHELAHKSKTEGFNAYISMPFTIEEFMEVISNFTDIKY